LRVVVETNVFVSAAIWNAYWPALTFRWPEQNGGLLKTPTIEQEVFEVVQRPRIARQVTPLFAERRKV
jgi:predicted nucleic acid-binding protein